MACFQHLTGALIFSVGAMMESLLRWPTEEAADSRTDIVRWWEARRLRFNFYVGAVVS